MKNEVRTFEIHWPGLERCSVMDLGTYLYVTHFKVKEGWRGMGVGSAVIRRLKKEGKRIELYPVPEFADDQQRLERFYYSHGFRPLSTRFEDSNLVWKPTKQ